MEPIGQGTLKTRPTIAQAPTIRRAQTDSADALSSRGSIPPVTNTTVGGLADRASPDVATALAKAEEAAGRSRTAVRDALADELTRLIALARELGKAGDVRSRADALQDLARRIAKVARDLADAERALPAADRRGVPGFAGLPAAAPGPSGASSDDNTGTSDDRTAAPAETTPTETTPTEAATTETATTETVATENGSSQAPSNTPFANTPTAKPPSARTVGADASDAEADRFVNAQAVAVGLRAELAAADAASPLAETSNGIGGPRATQNAAPATLSAADRRTGTRALLEEAAGILRGIRDAVKEAEILERFLDPEAAEKRAEEGREILRLENETRSLLAGLPEPIRPGGYGGAISGTTELNVSV